MKIGSKSAPEESGLLVWVPPANGDSDEPLLVASHWSFYSGSDGAMVSFDCRCNNLNNRMARCMVYTEPV